VSATMSKTFMSPDFLTKFLEEYREIPVLWQVRSADYSNRTKQDEAVSCFAISGFTFAIKYCTFSPDILK